MTLDNKLEFLKQLFLQHAFVKDAEKGYIVAEDFNLCIDPEILEIASWCWAEKYSLVPKIDAVVGLPDAGSRLVSTLAQMTHATRILPAKRTPIVPGSWRDVVSYKNASFTTEIEEIHSHIGFVKEGDRVLLVDDVVARGETAIAAIRALQSRGVEVVGLAVIFDKVWQGGVEKIAQETGVEVFSLIRLKSISPSGEITL